MEPSVTLELELTVTKGRGYVPADQNLPKDAPIGVIPIDTIYTLSKGCLQSRKHKGRATYGL